MKHISSILVAGICISSNRLTADSLDTTYQPVVDGKVNAIVALENGKAVVGGVFTSVNGVSRPGIALLNADGTLDNSFGTDTGVSGTNAWSVDVVLLQPDGKFLLGGTFDHVNGVERANIARLNSDGTVDTSFTANCAPVRCLALQADGKILFGGTGTNAVSYCTGRLTSDGQLDSSFQAPTLTGVMAVFNPRMPYLMSLQCLTNGQILLQGYFTAVNNTAYYGLARLHSDGSLDHSFTGVPRGIGGTDPYSAVFSATASLAIQNSGALLVGCLGTAFNEWNQRLVRLTPDGAWDTSFNPGFLTNDSAGLTISYVKIVENESILVSGDFSQVGGQPRNHIARLTPGGNLDSTFDAAIGANCAISAADIQPDGQYLIGGAFTNVCGQARSYLARLAPAVYTNQPPIIVQQPLGTNVLRGENIQLSLNANGTDLTFQWWRNQTRIAGATNAFLTITNAQSTDQGDYWAGVTNGSGGTMSAMIPVLIYSLAEAVRCPVLNFTSSTGFCVFAAGGQWVDVQEGKAWTYQTNVSHNGIGALQNIGLVGEGVKIPFALLSTEIIGPGTLSFWYRLEPQVAYATFGYQILSGPAYELASPTLNLTSTNWEQVTVNIPTGRHQFVWTFNTQGGICALTEVAYTPEEPVFIPSYSHYDPATGQQLGILMPADGTYSLEYSSDLRSWEPIKMLNGTPGEFINMVDSSATNRAQSFYRTVKQ